MSIGIMLVPTLIAAAGAGWAWVGLAALAAGTGLWQLGAADPGTEDERAGESGNIHDALIRASRADLSGLDGIACGAGPVAEGARALRDALGTRAVVMAKLSEHGLVIGDSAGALTQLLGDLESEVGAAPGTARAEPTEAMFESVERATGETRNMTMSINQVASSVEQMSSNLSNVANHSNTMVEAINLVAISIDEMRSSIQEVAGHSEEAAGIVREATELAERTDSTIATLGASAAEIGKVVHVINGIAEQTNLLALNATIEAASAGRAGRGFAVVANAVKELAKQTAQATDDIGLKIETMQANTASAVRAIQDIVQVIDRINGISQTIADATRSQTASSAEIVESTGEASDAAKVIYQNVREASKGATEIAQSAESLARASSQSAAAADNAAERVREAVMAAEAAADDPDAGGGGSRAEIRRHLDELTGRAREMRELISEVR